MTVDGARARPDGVQLQWRSASLNPAGQLPFIIEDVTPRGLRVPSGEFRPAPELGGGEQARGIANVTTHEGELVFVLDLSRFEKLAESFDHRSLLPPGEGSREDRT